MTSTAILRVVGRDHLLPGNTGPETAGSVWTVYQESFDGFCGAHLDPQFNRFSLPDLAEGVPRLEDGGAVVVVGTGPSLWPNLPMLLRLRDRASLWTSLRGAEALATHGIIPDVAIVQHASDLDAYLTARHLRDRNEQHALARVPVVLVEPRTPCTLVAGLRPERLKLVDGAHGWGLWPASLAALACTSGAATVALLGVDLGTASLADASQTPLRRLLALIAQLNTPRVSTLDAGLEGTCKPGWTKVPLQSALHAGAGPLTIEDGPTQTRAGRLDLLAGHVSVLEPLLHEARQAAALSAGGRLRAASDGALRESWRRLMELRHLPGILPAVQDGLGARFLPELWRRENPPACAGPLWRPLQLVTTEITLLASRAHHVLDHQGTEAAA